MEDLKQRNARNMAYYPPAGAADEAKHKSIRLAMLDCMDALTDGCPASRELSLALTKLEEAGFWANAAIARARAERQDEDAITR